ncbi:CoA pyrophosphatase [Niveibacterium umoris]|uniref:8-oxo-dGTP pyrophosphatase MutT (NUDIX family) n=1 Tax=Niveibacterium umoris TaxID=1193620 RepID=A0A840BKR4_9RHOO|nr:8-oxo-dGTP pyrophosphatase MutT (NUDIX family) [Niveibacterium umoris]
MTYGVDATLELDRLRERLAAASASRDAATATARDGSALTAAAVLVPLVVRPFGLQVLLTRRTAHLHHHPGQISFPGGRIEPDDASPESAALRETEEETGLTPASVEILGEMSEFDTSTGFRVTPVVGVVRPPLALRPDPFEVAEVFEVPFSFLLDRANHQRHEVFWRGRWRHYWAMPWGDYYIWGATAGILRALVDVLVPEP